MAFTPIDLPIQEMLQTDFIVDIATIHNSNVLLLKDKLEDVINNFEIDTNTISIGTDNPINSIRTVDIVIQDGGFVFQTGTPNQIIAKLEKNGSNESVFTVDNINVDNGISVDTINVNTLVINDGATISGPTQFTSSLRYDSQFVESRENISVTLEKSGNNAKGTVTLTNTSKRHIYVTLEAETAVGTTRVWNGTSFVGILEHINLNIDFDANNPPAQNAVFTFHIVDIIENSGYVSLLPNINATAGAIGVNITPGINQSTSNNILMHYDLASEGHRLGFNFGASIPGALLPYGANVTLNYIIDSNLNDRLIVTSKEGFAILDTLFAI